MASNNSNNNSKKSAKKRKDSKITVIVLIALCVGLVAIVGVLVKSYFGSSVEFNKEKNKVEASDNAQSEADVVISNEKTYVSWVNEVYNNQSLYMGKTIKIDGMFSAKQFDNNPNTYYYVYRIGPGCCGNDGSMCGFEFTSSGEYPQENDWIEVTGTLDSYEENGETFLTLSNSSVTVKQERGVEQVQDNSK